MQGGCETRQPGAFHSYGRGLIPNDQIHHCLLWSLSYELSADSEPVELHAEVLSK